MTAGLTGFVTGYAKSSASTEQRIIYRNIAQGGNHTLLAGPLASQATWAGLFMADVASVVMGPLSLIAQIFRIVFSPFISYPFSIISSAVKSGLYESGVSTTLKTQTRFFARGARVDAPVEGSVSLEVDGQMRHFMLGNDITYQIKESFLVEVDGKTKRYYVCPLRDGEVFDENCREIDWKGKKTRVKLSYEIRDNYVKQSIGDEIRYFRLGNEVAEPVNGTVAMPDYKAAFRSHDYSIGAELPKEARNCIKIKVKECALSYDTGKEIDAPTDSSRSFAINGTVRHFASAKYTPDGESLGLSGLINKIPRLPFHIPTRLSRFTIRALHLINENMSNVIRVALVSASVALIFFGSTAMAAGAIVAVSYEYLNHDLGIVPRKVALFMEKWMPTISMVGLLIVGSLTTQITAGATLLLTIPSVNLWVHQKVSNLIRKVEISIIDAVAKWSSKDQRRAETINKFGKELEAFPSLEECDAPLRPKLEMTLQEIEAILNAEDSAYEINPAHLTKDFRSHLKLPENRNFRELVSLWEKIEKKWLEPRVSERLFKLLLDDQRFIEFMQKRFPEAKIFHYERNWRLDDAKNREQETAAKENHFHGFKEWTRILAREKGCTREKYIADWIKQQLQHYVDKLTGNRPIEGEHRYLDEAIQNTSKLLPFLLDPAIKPIHLEDTLVKLAIEAGDYCALGSWRASREALESFTEQLPQVDANGAPLNSQEAFAKNVYLTLQKTRLQGVDAAYQGSLSMLRSREETRDTADDIHLHTAVTRALKRGFCPLAANDMVEFGLTELMIKETAFLPGHIGLLKMYKTEQVSRVMTELGIDRRNYKRNHVLSYLRTWVQENQALSKEAKKQLLKGALAESDENLADSDNYVKWNRLMLTILGVVRAKT